MRAVSRWSEAALLACALAAAGCVFGPGTRNYPPARTVHGHAARIETSEADGSRRRVEGELLAVTDSGVLLLSERGAMLAVSYPRTRWLRVEGWPATVTGAQLGAWPARRDELRALARFPYGMPPDALAALLADAGQTALLAYPLASSDPGTRPGIPARLRVVDQGHDVSLRGELLAADSAGLVIAAEDLGVVRVRYACVTRAAFDRMDPPPLVGGRRAPAEADLAALARHARYPQGMGPGELARLLPAGSRGLVEVRCE